MDTKPVKIALVGAGMFGGDVHARTYADLQVGGLAPQLGRLGFHALARDLGTVAFDLVAIATRTEPSARAAATRYRDWTGRLPAVFSGDTPWRTLLQAHPDVDVVAVATPDSLHTPVILDALHAGAHVVTEKPMCLNTDEADEILAAAERADRIVAVDMHKRYDPDHLRIRDDLCGRIGDPLYGTAYLEEPLQVSTSTFKWVEQSDPFSYVGSHWVDLICHYYGSQPVSLTAVGQKKRLVRQGINAYDAVQVRVDFANGMSFQFNNNWITPGDFEGPVNQGHEIVGVRGKVESDQQYRGLRWWEEGAGSRTANTHFTRDVRRPDAFPACVGYGVDSLVAAFVAICRHKFLGTPRSALLATYPNAIEGRITVAIVHAARVVCDRNYQYLQAGKGAPVTARFGAEGITIVDPLRPGAGLFERIYTKPL